MHLALTATREAVKIMPRRLLVTIESSSTLKWKYTNTIIMSQKLPFQILIKMSNVLVDYASMTRTQLLNAISIDLFYN